MVVDRAQHILCPKGKRGQKCPELFISNRTKRELSSSRDEYLSLGLHHLVRISTAWRGVTVC